MPFDSPQPGYIIQDPAKLRLPLIRGTTLSSGRSAAGESRRGALRGAAAGHTTGGGFVGQKRMNGRQQLLASSERGDAQLHEILLGQSREHFQINLVQNKNFCKIKRRT